MEIKFRFRLKLIIDEWGSYKKGDVDTFIIPLLSEQNGLIRFGIDKQWEVLSCDRFTGFKDKNEIDIFEKDQLFVSPGYSSFVEFKDGMFVSVYSHPEDGETLPLIDIEPHKCIIIQ